MTLKKASTPVLKSRINWAQIVATMAMLATLFGVDGISQELQGQLVGVIVAAQSLITFLLNTYLSED